MSVVSTRIPFKGTSKVYSIQLQLQPLYVILHCFESSSRLLPLLADRNTLEMTSLRSKCPYGRRYRVRSILITIYQLLRSCPYTANLRLFCPLFIPLHPVSFLLLIGCCQQLRVSLARSMAAKEGNERKKTLVK